MTVPIVGLLRDLIRHYQIGEHLLLIGNQGVGKIRVVKEVFPVDDSQWDFEIYKV